MKTKRLLVALTMIAAVTMALPAAASAFEIARFVIAGDIQDREPVFASSWFSSDTEKVYCFLEAVNIVEDTRVSFVWFHQGEEAARIELGIAKGDRWRTYSSKSIGERTGTWEVQLQDERGMALKSISFEIR